MNEDKVTQTYQTAKEQYASLGVDADAAMKALENHSHLPALLAGRRCGGFEQWARNCRAEASGDRQLSGKARTIGELRGDIEKGAQPDSGRTG